MYEVFNWGHVNESRPKRLSLFAGASEINIDDPPPQPVKPTTTPTNKPSYSRPHGERTNNNLLFLLYTKQQFLFLVLERMNKANTAKQNSNYFFFFFK